jgi:hypothetical protein
VIVIVIVIIHSTTIIVFIFIIATTRHVRAGRDTDPDSISLQSRTLRYNSCHWLAMLGAPPSPLLP